MSDVCVIGSGFSGSVVALKLTQGGASVTILEAGRSHEEEIPERLAVRYTNVGPITYILRDRIFRCVGGTSERWYGNCGPAASEWLNVTTGPSPSIS